MFDPTKPADHSPLASAEMRAQLTALFDLTQAIPPGLFTGPFPLPLGWNFLGFESWDGGRTYNPGDALTFYRTLYVATATNIGLPPDANPASWTAVPAFFDMAGAATAKADAAQAASSNNTNAVALLGLAVSDPPTQAEVQSIADKLDELITALRR